MPNFISVMKEPKIEDEESNSVSKNFNLLAQALRKKLTEA